jgi:hypothetical protein
VNDPIVREEACVGRSSPEAVRAFQKRLYTDYTVSVSLSLPYTYLYGDPDPMVPLDTAVEGMSVLGA